MGADKALLEIDGEALLARTLSLLASVTHDVRIACGVTPRYAEFGRALVLDRTADLGPLGGLEAALAQSGAEYVLATACDMPRLDARLIESLLAAARARALDVCVVRSERGVEPLCGVWRTSMLTPIRAALEHGERRVIAAFDELLGDGTRPQVGFVELDDMERVRNLNTPADFAAERRR
jgi:molybdopterin-guanine dinucleotide biosynthesis protein A